MNFLSSFRVGLATAIMAASMYVGELSATPRTSDEQYFDQQQFDPSNGVPKPSEIVGFVPGDRHLHPLQLYKYYEALAAASDRVSIIENGTSHEGWPLMLVVVSSADNIRNLDSIREAHLAGESDKLILWQGFSVHGNEASGANAAPLYAWWAAAEQSQAHQQFLDQSVILIDPVLNPDGLARFASWVNSHQSLVANNDGNNRDHHEAWPNGRTNHYWFDLNRDWLLAQHPESKSRLKQFHRWRPHVLTDFHEMGSHSNYFFQPGVPSRQNPNTDDRNFELVSLIAEYHAKALDAKGELYYTKEGFDDFYYGKGSTYPDIHGTVGILFEQGSARGHLVDAGDKDRSFADAVANQLATALSTTRASFELRQQLASYQADYLKVDGSVRGNWVVGSRNLASLKQFSDLLSLHDINHGWLKQDYRHAGVDYAAGYAIVVNRTQPQWRLIDAIFEVRTEFEDNTFYDVSAYNLALSYGFDFALAPKLLATTEFVPRSHTELDANAVAWLFSPESSDAQYYIAQLHRAGAKLKVISKPVSLHTTEGEKSFSRGAIMVASSLQKAHVFDRLKALQTERGWPIYNISSGLSVKGVDLGSPSVFNISAPTIGLIVGDGVSPYRAGELWHHIDRKLEYPVTLIDSSDIKYIDIRAYTHLVVAGGSHAWLDEKQVARLERYTKAGGVVVSLGGSVNKLSEWYANFSDTKKKESDAKSDAKSDVEYRSYASFDADKAEIQLGGAFLNVDVDATHPMLFGIQRSKMSVFKQRMAQIPALKDRYASPLRFAKDTVLKAGYLGDKNRDKLAGSPALTVQRVGQGAVISFAFDPSFRATMLGTEMIFINALFMSDAIRNTKI